MTDILKKIKDECEKHERCRECPLMRICPTLADPYQWDAEAIRTILGEPIGNCPTTCPTTEIIVPEKWKETAINNMFTYYVEIGDIMTKQNEIIACLEQIKGRLG